MTCRAPSCCPPAAFEAKTEASVAPRPPEIFNHSPEPSRLLPVPLVDGAAKSPFCIPQPPFGKTCAQARGSPPRAIALFVSKLHPPLVCPQLKERSSPASCARRARRASRSAVQSEARRGGAPGLSSEARAVAQSALPYADGPVLRVVTCCGTAWRCEVRDGCRVNAVATR